MNQSFEKVGNIILTLLVTGLFMAAPFPRDISHAAQTQSITDLQKKKQSLERQIKNDEAAKKQKQEEQTKLNQQIRTLNGQISGLEDKIQETETAITATQDAIQEKEQAIADKEAELEVEQDHQAETIRVIYESGHTTLLEIVVGSNSLSEALVYQDYLDALEGKIERSIEEINRIQAELANQKIDLETKSANLATLLRQQEAYQQGLVAQKDEKKRLFANAKVSEERIASQIAEAQKVYTDVNNELTKLMEAARRRAAQRASGQIPKGVSNVGFQYPVGFLYLSCPFGCRTPFQSYHTGIDLVNYMGTPVYAAGDGVVSSLGQVSYGYGTYAIIAHNERWSSLYAHFLGFADGLQVGQTIKRGDLVGYVGMTGWTTGPHLHFEIREYGIPVNPLDYLP